MILEDGKRYYGKVHNCLIDDWEAVKKDKTAGETVIYDVCSVCGYEKEKDKKFYQFLGKKSRKKGKNAEKYNRRQKYGITNIF